MNPTRELFARVMKEKVKEGENNPNKPTYQIVNQAILNLLSRGISLHIETVDEEVEKLRLTISPDKEIGAHRIRRHIFNTDGHLAINATLIKLGYRLYQKDKRVVMKQIHGAEEMAL
jgi:hypothetical protein